MERVTDGDTGEQVLHRPAGDRRRDDRVERLRRRIEDLGALHGLREAVDEPGEGSGERHVQDLPVAERTEAAGRRLGRDAAPRTSEPSLPGRPRP
jgi:hypothetical protein